VTLLWSLISARLPRAHAGRVTREYNLRMSIKQHLNKYVYKFNSISCLEIKDDINSNFVYVGKKNNNLIDSLKKKKVTL
jgi:hypothetical protein